MTDTDTAITIRDLASLDDYAACVALQNEIWGQGFAEQVPGAILRVSQKIGGVTAGAFDADGRMLGFVFGMTGLKDGQLVHWSDMLAVRPEARGTRLGARLKHYQREAVARLGVHIMYWTADPLVARNANLNINQLGALPCEYVENMYGSNTGSTLHGSMPTDRFVYRWDAPDARSMSAHAAAVDATGRELAHAIVRDDAGSPVVMPVTGLPRIAVPVPHDLEALQAHAPALALAWRLAVREAMQPLFAAEYRITHFVRGHDDQLPYYLFAALS